MDNEKQVTVNFDSMKVDEEEEKKMKKHAHQLAAYNALLAAQSLLSAMETIALNDEIEPEEYEYTNALDGIAILLSVAEAHATEAI